jgi:hypothetical protein
MIRVGDNVLMAYYSKAHISNLLWSRNETVTNGMRTKPSLGSSRSVASL